MARLALRAYLLASLALGLFLSHFVSKKLNPEFELVKMFSSAMNGKTGDLVIFFVLTLVFFCLFGLLGWLVAKKSGMLKPKENLGSSDFATEKEFDGFTGNDGLLIGKKFQLTEQKSFEHFCLIGPTGSGKSAAFFIPNLLSLPKHASVVVSDPKGELFEKTAQHALNQGKRVLVFSPFKSSTMKYNPLSLCRNVSEVRELAQILLANGNAAIEALTGTKAGGSEWTNMSTPLLSAFLIYVRDLKAPDNTVTKALNLIVENDLETLKFLMMDADEQARRQFNIFLQSAQSEQTASSIKTVLASNMQLFMDNVIEEVTSANEIQPDMLREQPTHLYVVVPEHKSDMMAPLMAPFYTQLFAHLLENGKGCPVYFLLDEMANIGIIPGLDKVLAVARSRKISISLGIQSVNQLKQRYDKAADTILDNTKTKCALPGLSLESAKFISDMLGFKEISTTSTSFGKKQDASFSVSNQKRELLTADEVRRLPDLHMLVISDNKQPFMTQQIRYYQDQKMMRQTKQEINLDEYVKYMRRNIDKKNKGN